MTEATTTLTRAGEELMHTAFMRLPSARFTSPHMKSNLTAKLHTQRLDSLLNVPKG